MSELRNEPIYCGVCLYGSDVGVPGYDDKGPAYINPACADHNPETVLDEDDPLRGPVCTDFGCPAGYPHHGPCPGEEDR